MPQTLKRVLGRYAIRHPDGDHVDDDSDADGDHVDDGIGRGPGIGAGVPPRRGWG